MLHASLLASLLLMAPTAGPAAPPAAPAAARVLGTAVPLLLAQSSETDRDLGPGLRNMAVGAAIGGVGLAVGAALLGGFLVVAIGLGIGALLAPSLVLPFAGPVFALAWSVTMLGVAGAFVVLFLGTLWFGVNALLVLLRLMPGYKPGPGTEYLNP